MTDALSGPPAAHHEGAPPPTPHPYDALRARLVTFVAERDWKQFHSPRNLAACLSVEAGELLELYMWTRDGEGPHPPGAGPPDRLKVEAEAADVLISLLNFCAEADIDLLAAAERKLVAIERKYPVAQARGVALRADALAAEGGPDQVTGGGAAGGAE